MHVVPQCSQHGQCNNYSIGCPSVWSEVSKNRKLILIAGVRFSYMYFCRELDSQLCLDFRSYNQVALHIIPSMPAQGFFAIHASAPRNPRLSAGSYSGVVSTESSVS